MEKKVWMERGRGLILPWRKYSIRQSEKQGSGDYEIAYLFDRKISTVYTLLRG